MTWISAALVALYMPIAGDWCMPPMEAVLTTEPPCSPIHDLTTSEVHSNGAHRLTSKILVKRAWSCSISGPYAGLVPALLTRMSTLPKRSSVRSTQRPRGVLVDGVRADAQGPVTDLRRGLLGGLLFAGGEHHIGAVGGQLLGDRQADSPRGAGDDCGAAGQIL